MYTVVCHLYGDDCGPSTAAYAQMHQALAQVMDMQKFTGRIDPIMINSETGGGCQPEWPALDYGKR